MVSPTALTAAGPLRALLNLYAGHGCPLADLTVLDVSNDPFRVDTPAGHRDGRWLATQLGDLGLGGRTIHFRGLHYALIGRAKPDGSSYTNTDKDWEWLQRGPGKAARWLGYVGFGSLIDQRNAPPVIRVRKHLSPQPVILTGVQVDVPAADEFMPEVDLRDFTGAQPFKLVMFGEKSSLQPVLHPIADAYGADEYWMTGEISDTLMHTMARAGAADRRPMVVFIFSDCDPAGWQMGISIARKLQALQTLEFPGLDFQVRRVALTPGQVREHALPSTPLKTTERRADAWRLAMGVAQTEIDSIATLDPDLLQQIARDAISPFFDHSLERRVRQARDGWLATARERFDNQVDQDLLGRLRDEAQDRLAELREQIDALTDAMQIDTGDIDLPPLPAIPDPAVDVGGLPPPLIDSRWEFAGQCRALIDSKAYRNGAAS